MSSPLIIAHRGASYDAPENTMAAFRLAWVQNTDALELDIHRTRDNEIVVIHDPDTLRTSGISKSIKRECLADLQKLDIGIWKGVWRGGPRTERSSPMRAPPATPCRSAAPSRRWGR